MNNTWKQTPGDSYNLIAPDGSCLGGVTPKGTGGWWWVDGNKEKVGDAPDLESAKAALLRSVEGGGD